MEETLEGYNRELESYRKRNVTTRQEMRNNTEKLQELNKNIESALTEYEVGISQAWSGLQDAG